MPDPDAAPLADPVHPPRDGLSQGPYGSDRERIGCTATGGASEVRCGVDGAPSRSQAPLRHEPIGRQHVRFSAASVAPPCPARTVQLMGDTPGPT